MHGHHWNRTSRYVLLFVPHTCAEESKQSMQVSNCLKVEYSLEDAQYFLTTLLFCYDICGKVSNEPGEISGVSGSSFANERFQ